MQGEAGLTSSSLQAVITQHVLPNLAVQDLGCLASTCQCLRSTVYQQDSIWRRAACARLPAQQVDLQFCGRAEVQLTMQQRTTAFRNMKPFSPVADKCAVQKKLIGS